MSEKKKKKEFVVSLVHVVELLENYLSWMGISAEAQIQGGHLLPDTKKLVQRHRGVVRE